ncbi:nuclear transport factor 2 family protein [Helicobacter sp. 11S02596-1]|uniref:nuclear transport factor 2 family protein n=1 Tax=Helicobacter sp. 11S02596-1 TaxID=1476194 RepID=UPI000BA5E2DE|nr:nuclear transport factor 2 family protein [Helicobacter sp. 11S02596-1]PAF42376.1 hypothetical protein BJI48_07135 [Helicobacter sp. 11S02596-1]
MQTKAIVQECFQKILEEGKIDNTTIEHYFSKNYTQCVNGIQIDFENFKSHLHKQRETIQTITIKFITLLAEGNIVFTNHLVNARKKDGTHSVFKVLAQFSLEDGKIIACDELTQLLEGNQKDSDLGSRH